MYPTKSRTQLVGDLMPVAVADVEKAFPSVSDWSMVRDPDTDEEICEKIGLRTFQDLFDGYGDVLRNFTAEHTSLRIKTEDRNYSRWPIHPFWTMFVTTPTFLTGLLHC